MKVYLVTKTYYDDWELLEVFSSLEKAREYINYENSIGYDDYTYDIFERILRD